MRFGIIRRMQHALDALPDNIDALKSRLADQAAQAESLAHQNTQLQRENERIKTHVLILQEQLNIAIAKRYAASSEQCSPNQIRLFDEAEVDTGSDTPDTAAKIVTIAGQCVAVRPCPITYHVSR